MSIVSPFQMRSSRIRKLNLSVGEVQKGVSYKTSFAFKCTAPSVEEMADEFHGKIAFCVVATIKNEDSHLLSVTLDIEGIFVIKNDESSQNAGIDIARFRDMVDMNGLVALSQIVRATLLSVTSQSGIQPSLMMPMININHLRKQRRIK